MMARHDRPGDDQPRGSAGAPRSGQADDAAELPPDGLTEDELQWVSGGTEPTEDEPFLPGTYGC